MTHPAQSWRTIGDVAAEVGVSPQTLRVWEKQELLVPDRTGGGQRRYTPDQVTRARQIAELRRRHGWNPAAIRISLTGAPPAAPAQQPAQPDGARLRRARLARGLSLATLARAADTSTAHLSSIERGLDRPSTQLVARLTDALGIPMSGLADFHATDASVVREGDRAPVQLENGAHWEELSMPGHQFEAAMLTIAPGGSSGGPYSRPGETFAHLLDGQVEFRLGGTSSDHEQTAEATTVGPGDSITVPPSIFLSWSNPGTVPARCLWFELLPPHAWSDPMTQRIVRAASGVTPLP
ncbi:MerR family transcriptional regulator [Nocardioides sp. LHD-245]|uniref:MerR family transcriptional regulator n=1 Tax=Nocardioides sp. LHD-245 TaxID=3051387 RepID=UPI0027DEC564|nr:MerR family transcriptional regulator [Nocardioides sp. LHD-245]